MKFRVGSNNFESAQFRIALLIRNDFRFSNLIPAEKIQEKFINYKIR